ncbi:MAG: Uncharacterized protein HPY66_0897 [Firmicutes bacterium]|nr:Uncharacterized protein [Bacillota bacterium]
MSKVWVAYLKDEENAKDVSKKILALYDAAGFKNVFSKGEFTAVKIHFGERNNIGHIKPEWIKPLLNAVKKTGCKPFLTDTNTLYKGQRQNSVDHLMQAYQHGFSIENTGVPIIIADGLLSKNFSEVEINCRHFKSVKIANDILHSGSMIVLSHMTGHITSGFGAAIKNLAMGAAPRSGKQVQHADMKPKVNIEKCRACGLCIQWCPRNAIEIYDGAARINASECYGCAECISACRFGAIKNSFKGTSKTLQEKMAEYTLGAVKGKEGKVCYFNFLTHITKECDCLDEAQPKISGDIGILASYDPVAIDQASVDLLKEKNGEDILRRLWPENDYDIQIRYAEQIGLGERKYQLNIV